MNISRHHADWLQLVDVSGAFLSLPVLTHKLPNGLSPIDRDLLEDFRLAYDEWLEGAQSAEASALDAAWNDFVLRRVLGFEDRVLTSERAILQRSSYNQPEHGETLIPDQVLIEPGTDDSSGAARLLLKRWPRDQELDSALEDSPWAASPEERLAVLCRATGVRLGLLTNGSEWMLVDASIGRGVTTATWHASDWRSEPLSLRSFIACLGVQRFFQEDEDHTLEALLDDALTHQQEVTAQLGNQVRRAVEVLVQAIDRVNLTRGGTLLDGVGPHVVYDGALTVMMRLVFLLAGEERELLLLGDPTYDQHYAVSTLRGQLREAADRQGIQVLERHTDAWVRLLSTFRAVYAGVDHERLRLPPLGGSLFDPDRYPFLEGRAPGTGWQDVEARPIPVDNRTVLHLLDALQLLSLPGRGGVAEAQRLSFRGLDIEQLGHVYEGLLDHTAIRVGEPTLGLLGTQRLEPEVGLSVLESARRQSEDRLVEEVCARTGRSASAISNSLSRSLTDGQRSSLLIACGNDEELCERITPYFHLLRSDVWGAPQIYLQGSYVVTTGDERGQTGAHYTPRSLTEQIVAETLEPHVYDGPREGRDRSEWSLRPPDGILDLKVCDPAMGSGAFLVRVCEWLADRLVESWMAAEREGRTVSSPGRIIDEESGAYEPLPASADDRMVHARRLIAERCLYGIDVNPMAVELAKLSLWLVTMSKGRPFGFLDHNLRCGDSLIGLGDFDQLRHFHIDPERGQRLNETPLFNLAEDLQGAVDRALEARRQLREIEVRDINDINAMSRLNETAMAALKGLRVLADGVVGSSLVSGGNEATLERLMVEEMSLATRWTSGSSAALAEMARRHDRWFAADTGAKRPIKAFHWAVEFPEVFLEQGGFDAFVGNPPFLGGKRITGTFGVGYRDYLVNYIANGIRGSADLVAYFFLRVHSLLRSGGTFGLLATNTIAEGDTRQVSLEPILSGGSSIFAAYPNEAWPGQASVFTSRIHLCKGDWAGASRLGSKVVGHVSAFLTSEDEWTPQRLLSSKGIAFIGSVVSGMGFALAKDEARALIESNALNEEALFPYLNGQDLNSDPLQLPSRMIISFWDWPLDREAEGNWHDSDEKTRARWLASGHVPADFPGKVAADFPDLLAIVRHRVKPERDTNKRKLYRERWWRYAEPVPGAYHAIGRGDAFWNHPDGWESDRDRPIRVLTYSLVSKFWAPVFVPNEYIFSNIGINAMSEDADFGLLQSCVHAEWAWKQSSRMKRDLRYTPSDILETFPFPRDYDRPSVSDPAASFHDERAAFMQDEAVGLTKFNNRFHDPKDQNSRLGSLRELQRVIDLAVCETYGWSDIDLGHDFHQVDYLPESDNVRFTISRSARLEILRRLSALNRERYDEEMRQGLHEKNGAAPKESRTKRTRTNSEAGNRAGTGQGALDL